MKVARTILATALLLGLVAGCGGKAIEPSPISDSTKPTSSPSGPPTLPGEAKGTGDAAAIAFLRYYMALYSYAASTGSVDAMRMASLEQCKSCSQVTAAIEKTYADGGSTTGRGYALVKPKISTATDQVVISASIRQFEQTYVKSQSASPTVFPEGLIPCEFTVTRSDGTWKMKRWIRE